MFINWIDWGIYGRGRAGNAYGSSVCSICDNLVVHGSSHKADGFVGIVDIVSSAVGMGALDVVLYQFGYVFGGNVVTGKFCVILLVCSLVKKNLI